MSNATATRREFAVTVTLKSGAQLHAECDRFSSGKNVFGDLREMSWENMHPQWQYLDLDEVAAVVVTSLDES